MIKRAGEAQVVSAEIRISWVTLEHRIQSLRGKRGEAPKLVDHYTRRSLSFNNRTRHDTILECRVTYLYGIRSHCKSIISCGIWGRQSVVHQRRMKRNLDEGNLDTHSTLATLSRLASSVAEKLLHLEPERRVETAYTESASTATVQGDSYTFERAGGARASRLFHPSNCLTIFDLLTLFHTPLPAALPCSTRPSFIKALAAALRCLENENDGAS